ncbi:MAG: TraB/GumN family protein [Candidatus Oxydemutatoraceae bacterium WSBS_2016_MAG_OTU14]
MQFYLTRCFLDSMFLKFLACILIGIIHLNVNAATEESPYSNYKEGVFWSISKDGQIAGYLFGTFHSNDKRVTQLPKNVKTALTNAKSFSMEAFPGARYFNPHWGFRNIIKDMTLPKGQTLEGVVGKDLYQKIEVILTHEGVKKERFFRLYPWAVINELGTVRGGSRQQASGPIMDHMLFEMVGEKVEDLYQVETLEELVAAYYDFPLAVQVALLHDRVANHENTKSASQKMLKAYLKEDLQGMLDISTAFISKESVQKGYKKIYLKNALFERNYVMAHHMLAPLRGKNAFIAVGALHIYGKEGVVNLIKNYGYSAQRIAVQK